MSSSFENFNQKKCLMVVDYQYDFVASDGILTVGEPAQKIEDGIYNLVNEYLENQDVVIFTLDEHKDEEWLKHPESKSFQIHCKANDKGSRLYGKLEKFMEDEKVSILKKNAFCITHKSLEQIVNSFQEILLVGVVTDICVLQNAIALYNLSANTHKQVEFFVKEDCCASFNPEGHKYAIEYMKNILGFKVL